MLLKVRLFVCRVSDEILLTYVKIATFNDLPNLVCGRCDNERKTALHALGDCLTSHVYTCFYGNHEMFAINEVLNGYLTPLHMTSNFARSLHEEFRLLNLLNRPILPRQPREERWCAPSMGTVKINVDAAWDVESREADIGCVARHKDSLVLKALRGMFPHVGTHIGA